jgi:hypothetical protein
VHGKKKACRPFGKQAGKIIYWVALDSFLLLAGVIDFNGGLPGATGGTRSHPHGPDSALVKIICARQLHLLRETIPQTLARVKPHLRRKCVNYKILAASSANSERSPFCNSMCAAIVWSRNLLMM